MGYDFHAADTTGLNAPPPNAPSEWYTNNPEYFRDYHVGGYASTGYWIGPALQALLKRADALVPMTGHGEPDYPAEVEEWFARPDEEEDAPMPDAVRAFLSEAAPEGKVLMYKWQGDSFIVTPAECLVIDRVITDAYSNGGMSLFNVDEVESLTHFGGYARFCADHGGFQIG